MVYQGFKVSVSSVRQHLLLSNLFRSDGRHLSIRHGMPCSFTVDLRVRADVHACALAHVWKSGHRPVGISFLLLPVSPTCLCFPSAGMKDTLIQEGSESGHSLIYPLLWLLFLVL